MNSLFTMEYVNAVKPLNSGLIRHLKKLSVIKGELHYNS